MIARRKALRFSTLHANDNRKADTMAARKKPPTARAGNEMRYTVLPDRMPPIPRAKMTAAQRKTADVERVVVRVSQQGARTVNNRLMPDINTQYGPSTLLL